MVPCFAFIGRNSREFPEPFRFRLNQCKVSLLGQNQEKILICKEYEPAAVGTAFPNALPIPDNSATGFEAMENFCGLDIAAEIIGFIRNR